MRASRGTIDDTISQNLNALATPAARGFNPATTSQRASASRALPAATCAAFAANVLFPSWQNRSDVLNYCAAVATSADPEEPDALVGDAAVDERLDPYSGRFLPKETRTMLLAGVVRNERMVEKIVRDRTWKVVGERCGDFGAEGESWQEALDGWRAGRA